MEKFEFYQDKKVCVWERTYFTVKANSREEAIAKAKEHYQENISDLETEDDTFIFQNCETVYDTIQDIPLEDNGGYSTCELYDNKNGNLLCGNGKGI